MNRIDKVRFFVILLIALIVILPLCIVILNNYQGHIRMESYKFTESSRELRNPRRGFYNLYRFMITDEKENYWQLVQEMYKTDENTSLTLVEVNLQGYRDNGISEKGMANIDSLFQALGDLNKQLIVRFVYDWDGENEKHEPESIDIILRHMEQLESVLQEAGRQIFILQGLFIGNWGEMNGTKYFSDGELFRLTEKLDSVTEQTVYLAVRTPSQWRRITGLQDVSGELLEENLLAKRISLFNDGMLGNESDYGTYRVTEAGGKKISEREEELEFQNRLCRWVPNGGEVINNNYYNDFDNALEDLASMHVTYLNAGHDQAVLDKWRETEVTDPGCYKGMDGYTYIERHLGYRLLIKETDLHYNSFREWIEIEVTMRNVGFAPLYINPDVELILYDKDRGGYLSYGMSGNLCQLSGGHDAEQTLTLQTEIPVDELLRVKYEVYFSIVDPDTGQRILLANEQDVEEYGYAIGTIELYE